MTTTALRHTKVHRVGLTAVAVGLSSLFAFPFASISPNRVVTGELVSVTDALPVWAIAVSTLTWLAVAVFSAVGRGQRWSSVARGVCASAEIVVLVWLSGVAAVAAVGSLGQFTRYSMGGGVWLSVFAAFALIVASRRELEPGSSAGWGVTLVAPIGLAALGITGRLSALGLAAEYRNVADQFGTWVAQHVIYSAVSVSIAVVVGVSLGIVAHRYRRAADAIFATTSVFQTIPGLAMIGILVVPLGALGARFPALREFGVSGLGWAPVVVALTLYALLAIVRNTYAGLGAVPSATVDAGNGMGMTPGQVMRKVQLPLAGPILFSGVRTASQQTIGNATLGAFVAAGTLGAPIFLGFAQQANDLVLLGSIALVAIALGVDGLLRGAQGAITPAHRRKGGGR